MTSVVKEGIFDRFVVFLVHTYILAIDTYTRWWRGYERSVGLAEGILKLCNGKIWMAATLTARILRL